MSRDACSSHGVGIFVHATFPLITDALHGGNAMFALASVGDEVLGADGHLGQRLGGDDLGSFVNVAPDRRPETVDEVDDEEDEEGVEQELGIEGQDVW